MPLKEEVLGQFLGDETFPIEWTSETEKLLFWVYDDLHCPKPLSPMYEDIGGWWLSCDHMFRRFGTPFATDWIYKNDQRLPVHGGDPGRGRPRRRHAGVQLPTRPRSCPRTRSTPARSGPTSARCCRSTATSSSSGGGRASSPRCSATSTTSRAMLDSKDQLSLAEVAVLLEDAIDMHDRHWKIHWMLNFAQLSATLNLRAVMEKTHGKIDEVLLGRLQNSANDRNWDKIRALWEMKEEVKGDAELARAFAGLTAADIIPALQASERGRRFIDERVVPYQKEFGWHAVWSHEFIFPSFREDMTPVIQLVRDQYSSDYDYPSKIAALKADIDAAAKEILEGLEGEALEEMRAANEINLKMAPLTPDHHFYIDQGANAHVRLVLIALGEKLVEMGVLDAPDDVILFRYNELRGVHRQPDRHRRAGHRGGRQGQARGGRRASSRATGSAPSRRRSSPSRTSTCGASRTSSTAPPRSRSARSRASPARRAWSRAWRASSCPRPSSTASRWARSSSAR